MMNFCLFGLVMSVLLNSSVCLCMLIRLWLLFVRLLLLFLLVIFSLSMLL